MMLSDFCMVHLRPQNFGMHDVADASAWAIGRRLLDVNFCYDTCLALL
jgi:hypothetical protein